ncbi:hypothetical protein BH11PAT1_BH11PAT1_3460 [soil metagenome]
MSRVRTALSILALIVLLGLMAAGIPFLFEKVLHIKGPDGECLRINPKSVDVTVPDYTVMSAGVSAQEKRWLLTNCGKITWGGYKGRRVTFDGSLPLGPLEFDMPEIKPGETREVFMTFDVPSVPGTYRAVYEIQRPDGLRFGDPFWVLIVVR